MESINNVGDLKRVMNEIHDIRVEQQGLESMIRKKTSSIDQLDFLSYIMSFRKMIDTNVDVDIWDKTECVILCENDPDDDYGPAWDEEFDPEIRKRSINGYDSVPIFDNGIDAPFVIEKIGDQSDMRCFSVRKIKGGKIMVKYKMDEISNVTGEVFCSWGGILTFDQSHFFNWVVSGEKSDVNIPPVPRTLPGY